MGFLNEALQWIVLAAILHNLLRIKDWSDEMRRYLQERSGSSRTASSLGSDDPKPKGGGGT